ncbi:MAG TPA: AraC family ligand binding domain-containing protein [Steroidobacteraceae bacterium]|nr:AraC family ligand binding domain-containing protein [Steroidobacteraceae bacterium]
MPSTMEWSHIHSRPDLSGLEVLHAHFLNHRYPKHAHEHAVIGLVESGSVSLGYRGVRHQIGANGIFFVNPEEPHDGVIGDPSDPRGYTYRAVYPTPEFLTNIVGEDHLRQLHFRDAVVDQPSLSSKLRCAHRAAVQQTGFDPTQSISGMPPGQLADKQAAYQRAMSTCLEGRGYVVG